MRTKPAPRLLWNASRSVPIGFYGVEPSTSLLLPIWSSPCHRIHLRPSSRARYVPRGCADQAYLALPGQSVCRNELAISVDGIRWAWRSRMIGKAAAAGLAGLSTIAQGEVFS